MSVSERPEGPNARIGVLAACVGGGEGGIRTRGAFAHRFSRAAPSTTRTPLRGRGYQTTPGRPSEGRGETARDRAGASAVSFPSRARRGTSGALYLQSAIAGLNPLPRSPFSDAARRATLRRSEEHTSELQS